MSIAIINKSAPYGTSNALESLDLVLAASNYTQNVSLFFIGDGVFQLLSHQDSSQLDSKNINKTLNALHFYDVEDLYVCTDSLKQRNLSLEQLSLGVTALPPTEIAALLTQHQHVLSF